MSVRVSQWAYGHDLKPGVFVVLLALADEATSDGYCFMGNAKLAWKANVSPRTLVRHLNELREMGLLHTERRAAGFGRGRALNAIVLHLDQQGTKGPYPEQGALDRRKAEDRRRYEVDPEALDDDSEPVDNRTGDQDAKVAPSHVSAGQSVNATLAPRTFKVPNQDVQSAKSGTETLGALRGTRARVIPSSPVQSSDRIDAAGVGSDGTGSDDVSPGVNDQPGPSMAYRGVPLGRLRSKLGGASGLLAGVDDPTLCEVINLVFARASGPVVSPLGLMIRALRQPGAAEELLEEAAALSQAKAEHGGVGVVPPVSDAAWAQIEDEMRESVAAAEEAEAKRLVVCPVHHIQHLAAVTCPGCRADKLTASTTGDDTAAEAEDFDVEAWRARRQEQRRAAAEQGLRGSRWAGDR